MTMILLTSILSMCSEKLGIYPPLPYQTPIAAVKSQHKALVKHDGAIQLLRFFPETIERKKNLGVLARVSLLSAEDVETYQTLRPGPMPAVVTVKKSSSIEVEEMAFAAEPESNGFYVQVTVRNRGAQQLIQLETRVENVSDLCLRGTALANPAGLILLETLACGATEQAAVVTTEGEEDGGIPYLKHTVKLNNGDLACFVLHLPVNGLVASEPYEDVLKRTEKQWQELLDSGMSVSLPDPRIQQFWISELGRLFMMLEPREDGLRVLKGLTHYYGSNPYDTLRASRALDVAGFRDEAEALLRRQLKRVRPDGIFEMWERDVPPSGPVEQWIVQGLAPIAFWLHYTLWRDEEWLREIAPVVIRAAKATRKARHTPEASGQQGFVSIHGFVPPGTGDGGLPQGYNFPQNFGPLAGIWVALQVARKLDLPDVTWLEEEFDDYQKAAKRVVEQSAVKVEDHQIISAFPGADGDKATHALWGIVMGVHPFGVLAPRDPLALGTLRFLQSTKEHGLHHNLGYSKGVWPYLSADIGHWHLRLGEFDEARSVFEGMLNYASPTLGWYEEIETKPPKGYGFIPDVWATSESVHLLRELLVFDTGETLRLLPAVPADWLRPGKKLEIKEAPTKFGICSFKIECTDKGITAEIESPTEQSPSELFVRLLPDSRSKVRHLDVHGGTSYAIDGCFIRITAPSKEVHIEIIKREI